MTPSSPFPATSTTSPGRSSPRYPDRPGDPGRRENIREDMAPTNQMRISERIDPPTELELHSLGNKDVYRHRGRASGRSSSIPPVESGSTKTWLLAPSWSDTPSQGWPTFSSHQLIVRARTVRAGFHVCIRVSCTETKPLSPVEQARCRRCR